MESMDTLNWAEKQNKFCDEWADKLLPVESWNRKVEHKASFALEAGLPLTQDLRYCSIYKRFYLNSTKKEHRQQYINWNVAKDVLPCKVTFSNDDYLEAITIIRFLQSKHRSTLVVVIPPMLKEKLWAKFKEYHLRLFLSELERLGVPCCERMDDAMLRKAGRFVVVFSVATSKVLTDAVLHEYLTVCKHRHNGFVALSLLYGADHTNLKNVYPVG